MANITLSLPEEVYRRMKKRWDVRWSEVARRAIIAQLEKLEGPMGFERSTGELRAMLVEAGAGRETVPFKKAVHHYREVRRLDWKRARSVQGD